MINQTHASPTSPTEQRARHLVLLVDDDPAILEYLKPALTTDTLSCITAASVGEAVEVLRNSKVDLLVLDWSLDRSGIEVLRAARETSPSMPVIAISGLPYEVRTDAVMHRVDAFLHKPLSGEVLRSQVAQLLQRVDVPGISLPKRAEEVLPLDQVKATYIEHVVTLLDNNVTLAAKVLGIHRQTVSAVLERAESDHGGHCGRGLRSRQKQLSAGDAAKRSNACVGEEVGCYTT
jgi:DNA-binding response OmpR family regulator